MKSAIEGHLRYSENVEKEALVTLRIQRSVEGGVLTLTLSGRINVDEVGELQRLLEGQGQDLRVVLDLKDVKLVDRDAVKFLAVCEANGTQVKNCPAYIREWIAKEGGPG